MIKKNRTKPIKKLRTQKLRIIGKRIKASLNNSYLPKTLDIKMRVFLIL